jgi:hypothetical protein
VTWLSWRQQRTETLIMAALLALLTAAFVPSGIQLADRFAHDHISRCVGSQTQACSFVVGNFAVSAGLLRTVFTAGWFNFVPGLIGLTLAVPLLLDLENGTVRLAWTQSVTRRRWLAWKLGLSVGTVLLAAAGFSLLFTWYQQPLDRVFGHWDEFDFEWLVPLGYALFALGLALAIGVVLQRIGAVLAVAFGVFVAVRVFEESWLRQRLFAPLSATFGPLSPGPNLNTAWVISQQPSTKAGHPFSGGPPVIQTCARLHGGFKGLSPTCLARHGAGFTHVVYEPASRFWEFQGVEFALFAGVGSLLLAFAAWRVLRAD